MKTTRSIRTTRVLLAAAAAAGLLLVAYGLLVGMNIPGLIASVAGWSLVITCVVWLVVSQRERSAAASRARTWRPGDEDQSS